MSLGMPMSHQFFYDSTFSLQKTYVLAEIAESAYLDYQCFSRMATHWGVTDWTCVRRENTVAYAFIINGDAFIAFRGTHEDQIHEMLLQTTKVTLNPQKKSHGKVHGGFLIEAGKLWSGIAKWILSKTFNHLYTVGHSMGAALALLTSVWINMPEKTSCYMFGTPRIGDNQFKKYIDENFNCYRIVNNKDLVVKLPPSIMNYAHVGQLTFIDKHGRVSSYIRLADLKNLNSIFFFCSTNFLKRIFKEGFSDHSIREYKRNLQYYVLHDKSVINYYKNIVDKNEP